MNATAPMIRQMLAGILLLCLGAVLPLSGTARLICLVEPAALEAVNCCSECQAPSDGRHDDCCVKIGELPDAPLPGAGCELPPMIVADLVRVPGPMLRLLADTVPFHLKNHPVRSPTTPTAFRAVLGNWRI